MPSDLQSRGVLRCVQDERSRPLVNCVWMALHNELLCQLYLELSHHSAALVRSPAAAPPAPPSSSSDSRPPQRAKATRVAACLRNRRTEPSSSSTSADSATAARTVSERSPHTAEAEKPTNSQQPTRKPHERVSVRELRALMRRTSSSQEAASNEQRAEWTQNAKGARCEIAPPAAPRRRRSQAAVGDEREKSDLQVEDTCRALARMPLERPQVITPLEPGSGASPCAP